LGDTKRIWLIEQLVPVTLKGSVLIQLEEESQGEPGKPDSPGMRLLKWRWCVVAFRPSDRSVKQHQALISGILSSTDCQDSINSKLTQRVNRPAAESTAMTTSNAFTSGQSQFAKSSSLAAVGSSQLQPMVRLLISIVMPLVIIEVFLKY